MVKIMENPSKMDDLGIPLFLTSIFEGQPPKTRPFPIKTRVIWVLGLYMYLSFSVFHQAPKFRVAKIRGE